MNKLTEDDIVYERGDHWALRVLKGFWVLRAGLTHSTRCAVIGYIGEEGLRRAIAEVDRREGVDPPPGG